MVIRFTEEQQSKLQSMPESGMGFQAVDLIFKSGEVMNDVFVYNCSECLTHQPFKVEDITEISMSRWSSR